MELEDIACEELGLKPAPISNQIIQRDRYARVASAWHFLRVVLKSLRYQYRSLGKETESFMRPKEYFG